MSCGRQRVRRWRVRLATALAAAAGVAAAGCSAVVPTTAPGATGGDAMRAAVDTLPSSLHWAACGEGLDCATLEVAQEYTDPDGPRVPLSLTRHVATDPQRRIGSLLVNPGGPGGEAGDFVRSGVTVPPGGTSTYFGPEVLARYDIIGMDPRGVGGSKPVECLTDAQREEALAEDIDVDLPGGFPEDRLDTENREFVEACAARNDPAFLASVSTDNVARDMNEVAIALGEQQVSYLGLSYGTLLGATFATLFPERVRHMVLDAPVDPFRWQRDPLGLGIEQAESGERIVDLYLETCALEEAACGFGDGKPAEAFDALVDRLETEPLTAPAQGAVPAVRIDGATVLLAARLAAFDRSIWPVLTAGLIAAEAGDGAILGALATALSRNPDGTPNALGEANVAVNCADQVRVDRQAYDRQAAELAALPRFGTLSAYAQLACSTWPVDNPDRFTGPYTARGAPPILVVGGEIDSQTPYPWAEAMTEQLDRATLLTRTGIGHGSYGGRANGPCVDDAVDLYLTTGELPAAGTVCVQEPPATTAPPK